MNIVEEKWPQIIEHLRVEHDLTSVSFSTWIQPLKVYDVVDDTVFILVSIDASVEYIDKKYRLPLKVCIADVTGKEYEVVFISAEDNRMKELSKAAEAAYAKKNNSVFEKAGLNPKYTFDTFVVGSNNKFAHAASLAIAESPGQVYNPFFLYGGVGLGKTHLMHSIAHFVLEQNPNKKVLYVSSESFTNELIDALRNGRSSGNESPIQHFRDKYRNIDVLLVDDIQFIIGKESTQEEFFHTFNHLHTLGKQIIISSDKPPKDMETLEARLRTRFEWGLISDISSPDYETRMAILQKKIEVDNLQNYHIPSDVLDYIAQNIKSNIRELEGSLNKLVALYKLNNYEKPIDISLAAEALKDMISSEKVREITPEMILDIVSEHFNVSIEDLKSTKRNAEIAFPRQVAMYFMRTLTDAPLKTIGIVIGGKDHSTIKYGVEKIAEDRKTDEALSNTLNIIAKKINPTL